MRSVIKSLRNRIPTTCEIRRDVANGCPICVIEFVLGLHHKNILGVQGASLNLLELGPWKIAQRHQGFDEGTWSKVLQYPHHCCLARLIGADQDRLPPFDLKPAGVLDAPVVLNSRPREPHHISRYSVRSLMRLSGRATYL